MALFPRQLALLVGVLCLQLILLTIGIGRDYRLKHEDNNALHATFARSHLQLGFNTTRAQNYFYAPSAATGTFYANHPPGPALVLAAVYRLTGRDGPLTTRATAVAFHMLAAIFLFGLVRRVSGSFPQALSATLLFAMLPESAFFGRMVNHEVLVLPAGILLVWIYWEFARLDAGRWLWRGIAILACAWAALAGWAGFFVIAACGAHAVWEAAARRNPRGSHAAWLLLGLGLILFAADLLHLVWVLPEPLTHLSNLLSSRVGGGTDQAIGWRVSRILEVHWRYFSLTGMVAIAALVYRGLRDLRRSAGSHPLTEVGLILCAAGMAYVAVFNLNAAQHDYWQFLLLPASAIALVQALHWLYRSAMRTRRLAVWAVGLLACTELLVTTGFTLTQRHTKSEAYCVETVERLRRDVL